jgi:hypothetical protein
MKQILLGLALAGLSFACRSTAEVSDTSEAMTCEPGCEMACCTEGAECTAEMKAECEKMSAEKAAMTCPVTGKTIQ